MGQHVQKSISNDARADKKWGQEREERLKGLETASNGV